MGFAVIRSVAQKKQVLMAISSYRPFSRTRDGAASNNVEREVKRPTGDELIRSSSSNLSAHHKIDLFAKRAFDLVIAAICLVIFLPILIVTSLAIWLEDRGPILFQQTRIGASGAPFSMLKFRSMCVDAEEQREALLSQSDRTGGGFKMRSDPRMTRIGKLIRRFSVDELPQLINVLTGTMSLVGPRPGLPSEVANYSGKHWDRLMGKPGITCTWQVRGRANISFPRQAIMDRAYLKRRNIWIDIKLLLCTPRAVLSGHGAF